MLIALITGALAGIAVYTMLTVAATHRTPWKVVTLYWSLVTVYWFLRALGV